MLVAVLRNGRAGEWSTPCEHLVCHDTQGVDVGCGRGSFAAPSLWGSIRRRKRKLVRIWGRRCLCVARDPEVRQAPPAGGGGGGFRGSSAAERPCHRTP